MKRRAGTMFLQTATVIVAVSMATLGAQAPDTSTGVKTDEAKALPIRYEATAVRPVPPTRPVNIMLSRWSTDAERQVVAKAFKSDENEKQIADTLGKMAVVGSFRTVTGRANPIHFAKMVTATDGTKHLILATSEPVAYWAGNNPPGDMPRAAYTLIEIHFDKDGTGTGRVSYGGDVSVSGPANVPTIEHYTSEQADLIGVKRLGTA